MSAILRIHAALKAIFGRADHEAAGQFMRAPNSDLGGYSPLDLIKRGEEEVVADFLEDKLLGHPN